jgi:hypothetical protein
MVVINNVSEESPEIKPKLVRAETVQDAERLKNALTLGQSVPPTERMREAVRNYKRIMATPMQIR